MPGPPKTPLEQRRRKGRSPGRDSGGRPLPDRSNVLPLRGVDGDGPPQVPDTLVEQGPGAERWVRLWREASWLAPATDIDIIARLCESVDLVQAMREALADQGFYVTGSQGQVRPNPLIAQIRATGAQIIQMERECGLTPSSRGGLGVGEVRQSPTSSLAEVLAAAARKRGARSAS